MKSPGPDHPISVTPNTRRVRVTFRGRTLADTTRALSLKEASYPAVHYIPREDVEMTLLQRSSHTSHCPYKGEAAYFSIAAEGRPAENAVWTYEAPFPAVGQIKDHLAFYPNKVDAIEESDPAPGSASTF